MVSPMSEKEKIKSDIMGEDRPKDTVAAKIRENEQNDRIAKILRPYCSILVRYPLIMVGVILFILIFSIILSIIPALGSKDPPDFSKPTKGFEPRGTTISKRSVAYQNLLKFDQYGLTNTPNNQSSHKRKRRSVSTLNFNDISTRVPDFFMVYERSDSGNMLNEADMLSLCRLHKNTIGKTPDYSSKFYETHHLPNYIAYFSQKSDCEHINQTDVDNFKSLLLNCSNFFRNGMLYQCLTDRNKCNLITKLECRENSNLNRPLDIVRLLYNTFQYFSIADFANNPSVLAMTGSTDLISSYNNVEERVFKPIYDDHLSDLNSLSNGNVKLIAFDMWNWKFYLFQTEIIIQSLFIIAAIILVILFIWFFSGSLFIGLMTLACILIALAVSYFVYTRVFNMNFFPFLNMVTLIFIVGIGADDAFVYTGIWSEALEIYAGIPSYEDRLIQCTIHSIRHALLAMLVTSLTTASAFYANVSSVVTSVKCFGLFAGTAIIVNYMLMVTFFPVAVILHEKVFGPCMNRCCPTACKNPQGGGESNSKLHKFLDKVSYNIFKKYLPLIVIKFKFVWIVLLLALGIGGCVVTFAEPGLNPPSTGDFQMFISSSPLEQFELNYKRKFRFGAGSGGFNRQIFFVFGVEAEDNGYKFDPDDKGTLVLKPYQYIDLGSSQEWLKQFCENLYSASFIQESQTCDFLNLMYQSLEASCTAQQTSCCNETLPMDNKVFMECLRESVRENVRGRSEESVGYPLFDQKGNLKVMVLAAESKFVYSDEFKYNKDASDTVNAWFDKQMANVTSSTMDGWWYIFNTFYDLQLGLFDGTKQSLGIAIAVAFLVILLTTLNILLSLYSILTITFIISVTVGILVLSGWKLNILESIVFSVAAGLSADFTLHYSVAYQTSLHKNDRVERVKGALSHIGPAILMGAVTTFIAGLVMTPSQVLVYLQMAQFLMLVMFVSWVYSTLFFLPLCAFIGPVRNVGQLTCQKMKRAKQSIRNSVHRSPSHEVPESGGHVQMEPVS